ncbi:H/ACA ribonucleoprotein complex non-core subunit NAF1-like isoform X2 [Acanthaster planci]|uniref:H/ACA ribonucleoprotein complex non-core subunit NAF1 n=1 Tax=Acanthaster planci TaxID=133434 RepID=A0A8B7YI07_ACAPL|nr:H/ACA ribonucleoprotein complex non-core subunit NAF1-like isoform X2 [Acanthaster planci]
MDPQLQNPSICTSPSEEKVQLQGTVKQEHETDYAPLSCMLGMEESSVSTKSRETLSSHDECKISKLQEECAPCIPYVLSSPSNTAPVTTPAQVNGCIVNVKLESDNCPAAVGSGDTSTVSTPMIPCLEDVSQACQEITGDTLNSVSMIMENLPQDGEELRLDSEDTEDSSASSSSSDSVSETEEDSSSSSDSSSEDSSSSDDEGYVRTKRASDSEEEHLECLLPPPTTAKEVLIKDLPPVQPVDIVLKASEELKPAGVVSSIIGQLVVIQSNLGVEVLDSDTVLFLEDRKAIGMIFEVFGPVSCPLYTLRFNSVSDIKDLKIELQTQVFFAPKIQNMTTYVFTQRLKQLKGSDASWENDEEPPPECVEFSDDEEERAAKNKKKNEKRKRKTPNKSRDTSHDVTMTTDKIQTTGHLFPSGDHHGYHESTSHRRSRGGPTYGMRPRLQHSRGRGVPHPPFRHPHHPRPRMDFFSSPWHTPTFQQQWSSFHSDHVSGVPGQHLGFRESKGFCVLTERKTMGKTRQDYNSTSVDV